MSNKRKLQTRSRDIRYSRSGDIRYSRTVIW